MQRLRSLLRRIALRFDERVRPVLVAPFVIRTWWRYLFPPSGKGDISYAFRSGLTFTAPGGTTDVNPFTDIWLRRVYDSPRIHWSKAKIVIDIGAHIGAFSLYAAERSPKARIVACEPEPVSFSYLQRNIRENHLDGRIVCRKEAIGGTRGEAGLNVHPGRGEGNSFFRSVPGSESVTVPVIRLQDLLEEERIERCDILKMNAEGVEYEILYSLPPEYFKRIDAIVMNYHLFVPDPRATPSELQKHLEQQGFTVREQGKRIFVATRP